MLGCIGGVRVGTFELLTGCRLGVRLGLGVGCGGGVPVLGCTGGVSVGPGVGLGVGFGFKVDCNLQTGILQHWFFGSGIYVYSCGRFIYSGHLQI